MRLLGGTGVGVVEPIVTHPGYFAGGGDGLTEHLDDITFPRNFLQKFSIKTIGILHRKNGAVVEGLTMRWQEVLGSKKGSAHVRRDLSIFWLAKMEEFGSGYL